MISLHTCTLSKLLSSIFFFTLISPSRIIHATKEPSFFLQYCITTSGNYTQNSTYQKNLDTLLKDLTTQSASVSFYNTTTGANPDEVFGLFLCRGDLSHDDCHACIKAAATKATSLCSIEKEAIIWYYECMLRYANRNIFSLEEEYPWSWFYSKQNVSMDLDQFNNKLSDAADKLINQAAYNTSSPPFFQTVATDVSSAYKLYMLVQCTPDISPASCNRCLRTIIRDIPSPGLTWVIIFRPSCQMRYDLAPFLLTSPSPPTSLPPPTSPSPPPSPSTTTRNGKGVVYYVTRIAIPATVVLLVLLAVFFILVKRSRKLDRVPAGDRNSDNLRPNQNLEHGSIGGNAVVAPGVQVQNTECVQFNFKTIETATNKFSLSNKLGEGGFGVVYRGVLHNGELIAVKRLSTKSVQGAREFMTEVEVVAKLQHKNLVRLVGFCVDGDERLLAYEFMPNLSLDRFLFGSTRAAFLTWPIRCKIIVGIARGLHYLHEDSRINIVHRDLKASNILLDDDLNPKIADFGMARLVKVNQTAMDTTKVVGTFGYMAPEYAIAGRFSPKSDVYSFGVIILEILSGKNNSQFYQRSHGDGLLRYAWRVWSEGAIDQLIDPVLQNSYSSNEAERLIRIGLLCVQDDESNRPSTQALLVMLSSNSVEVPRLLSPPTSLFPNNINKLSSPVDREASAKTQPVESSDAWTMQEDIYAR